MRDPEIFFLANIGMAPNGPIIGTDVRGLLNWVA